MHLMDQIVHKCCGCVLNFYFNILGQVVKSVETHLKFITPLLQKTNLRTYYQRTKCTSWEVAPKFHKYQIVLSHGTYQNGNQTSHSLASMAGVMYTGFLKSKEKGPSLPPIAKSWEYFPYTQTEEGWCSIFLKVNKTHSRQT